MTPTQGLQRDPYDVQPVAVLELDDATRFSGNKAHDAIKKDTVGQVRGSWLDLPAGGTCGERIIRSGATICTIER